MSIKIRNNAEKTKNKVIIKNKSELQVIHTLVCIIVEHFHQILHVITYG